MRFKKDEIYIIDSLNYVYCYCQDNKHWFTDYPSGESIVGFVYRCKSLKNAQLYEPFEVGETYTQGRSLLVYVKRDEWQRTFRRMGDFYPETEFFWIPIWDWRNCSRLKKLDWDIGL